MVDTEEVFEQTYNRVELVKAVRLLQPLARHLKSFLEY